MRRAAAISRARAQVEVSPLGTRRLRRGATALNFESMSCMTRTITSGGMSFENSIDIPPDVIVLVMHDIDSKFNAVAPRRNRRVPKGDTSTCARARDMAAARRIAARHG